MKRATGRGAAGLDNTKEQSEEIQDHVNITLSLEPIAENILEEDECVIGSIGGDEDCGEAMVATNPVVQRQDATQSYALFMLTIAFLATQMLLAAAYVSEDDVKDTLKASLFKISQAVFAYSPWILIMTKKSMAAWVSRRMENFIHR